MEDSSLPLDTVIQSALGIELSVSQVVMTDDELQPGNHEEDIWNYINLPDNIVDDEDM